MTTTRRPLRFLALVAAASVLALSWLPAGLLSLTSLPAFAAQRTAFTIRDPRVVSPSGLTRDVGSRLFWTVNRSGPQGTVFGVTPQGGVRGIIGFRARPVDVEAVVMHNRRLYVADVGDPGRRRTMVTVYYFDNPRADNLTVPYRAMDFRYPDGAHDARTLLVDGRGRLYVVTDEQHAGIYAAPARPSRQGVNLLRRVADAPAYVTDGTYLPGGNRIALRTYASVVVLDATKDKPVARAPTPYQKQGESIAVDLDGRSLLLGSADQKSAVLRVGIPTRLGPAPSGTRTPPPSTKPTPTPSASASTSTAARDNEPPPDARPTPTLSRTGTLLAVASAAFVSLVAGVVVAARRK